MANEQEADKRLLEFGLGSVTWWGYSSACDLSSLIDKKGKSIQYFIFIFIYFSSNYYYVDRSAATQDHHAQFQINLFSLLAEQMEGMFLRY